MSSSNLSDLFKKVNISLSEKYLGEINNLTTNLDKSDKNSIAFYNITDVKNIELFEQRLARSKAHLIITCCEDEVVKVISGLSNKKIHIVDSKDFNFLQEELLEYFYPILNEIKICGITGTNGKTTVAHLCNGLSRILGKKTLSIGTLGVVDQDGRILEEINATTPSRIDLRRIIFTYQKNYDALFLEVSSHGLVQGRMKGISFSVAAWTSFSQDHLDYHQNMQQYFEAKSEIFHYLNKGSPLFLPEKEHELIKNLKGNEAIIIAKNFEKWKCKNVNNVFKVAYNNSNLELSLEIVNYLWEIAENINLETLSPPPGRFSLMVNEKENEKVIVDYAHTPDALENICLAVRKEYQDHFLITVFGCGGNRDPLKRPLMGKAAELYSDLTIVTSDNPRLEKPDTIINEIIEGMKKDYIIETDRKMAISKALSYKSQKPKVVIIAGKGHEEYQDTNGVKKPFSDFTVVKEIWDNKKDV